MNYFLRFLSIVFGLVFMFSGFVKAIDPLGTAYKIEDYFMVWGFQDVSKFAVVLSIFLSAIEFVIGSAILFKIKPKVFTLLAFFFTLFMTPLTLWIAIENPVTDCGCFGDAFIISNWSTFIKNIFLLLTASLLFYYNDRFTFFLSSLPQWQLVITFFFISVAFSIYGLKHLPMIDFRPYKVGTDIAKSMEIPDDAPRDVYDLEFIYEKDGVEKVFTLENYPANDDTWKFVEQRTKLISKGYEPPIHDFNIFSSDGENITAELLSDTATTYFVVMYDLKKIKDRKLPSLFELHGKVIKDNIKWVGVTASPLNEINKFKSSNNVDFDFYQSDERTLKTIIRANPGVVVLKNGVVIDKWAIN